MRLVLLPLLLALAAGCQSEQPANRSFSYSAGGKKTMEGPEQLTKDLREVPAPDRPAPSGAALKAMPEESSAQLALRREQERRARADYLANHPDLSRPIHDAIETRNIIVGMNREQVKASWGAPTLVSRTPGAGGADEHWQYHDYAVLFFTDGILISWRGQLK